MTRCDSRQAAQQAIDLLTDGLDPSTRDLYTLEGISVEQWSEEEERLRHIAEILAEYMSHAHRVDASEYERDDNAIRIHRLIGQIAEAYEAECGSTLEVPR